MKVNICGVPHEIIECSNDFDATGHFGQIDYTECRIKINKGMPEEMKKLTIIHEMVHGILHHIGQDELAEDEKFVCVLGNAIFQSFDLKGEQELQTVNA